MQAEIYEIEIKCKGVRYQLTCRVEIYCARTLFVPALTWKIRRRWKR